MPKPRGATRRHEPEGEGDWYKTEEWGLDALMDNEQFEGQIWECACGDGVLAKALSEKYHKDVIATDLYDRGYGGQEDFILSERRVANIITNPPFDIDEAFVLQALDLVDGGKVAFLLKLDFLASVERYAQIYSCLRPARVWVFTERLTIYKGGMKAKGNGLINFAWYIWEKGHQGDTVVKWLPPIYKPTTRQRPRRRDFLQVAKRRAQKAAALAAEAGEGVCPRSAAIAAE